MKSPNLIPFHSPSREIETTHHKKGQERIPAFHKEAFFSAQQVEVVYFREITLLFPDGREEKGSSLLF